MEKEKSNLQSELERLRLLKSDTELKIQELEARLSSMNAASADERVIGNTSDATAWKTVHNHTLSAEAIYRYSRHLLLPAFGVQGQSNLLKTSVLLVGVGGLGSPVALYLAACGIGCLGIIDHDIIEMNNLQRQVIHSEKNIGQLKVKSAAAACHAINSTIHVVEYNEALTVKNALDIFSEYDIVVDATDNLPTRYLINDCCVIVGKPLVSGAALGLEGQLTVYNYNHGPCFRCLIPSPPPRDACQRCSDNGVLGIVPGIIGCLQALEVIKIASGVGDPLSGRMLIFSALATRIHTVKLRKRSLNCCVCGDNPEITYSAFKDFDYERFTESPMSDEAPSNMCLLPSSQRITSIELSDHIKCGKPHVLLDVREEHQYKIAALPKSLNIPLLKLEAEFESFEDALKNSSCPISDMDPIKNGKGEDIYDTEPVEIPLYVICRRGNDSQRAVQYLRTKGYSAVWDVIGGLESWRKHVDPDFPAY